MTEPVPDLSWEYPLCSVCDDGGNVSSDGGSLWCEVCGCGWSMDGTRGHRE